MNAAVPLHRERESFRLPFPFLPAPGRADPGATSAPACERLPLISGAASGFGALCLVFVFKHRIPVTSVSVLVRPPRGRVIENSWRDGIDAGFRNSGEGRCVQ